MKRHIKRMIAFLLVLILSVQLGEIALAATAEEIRVALDPTSDIQLSVPADLTEGNWFSSASASLRSAKRAARSSMCPSSARAISARLRASP